MKKALLCMSIFFASQAHSQCYDVYGHKTDCPTAADSLTLYNNAVKVYEFYEKNNSYQKLGSDELTDESQKRSVYNDLETAKRMFFVIRREVAKLSKEEKRFSAGKPTSKYKDVKYSEYYAEIDEHRFYQREMENQIVNIGAPMSMYDTRISPIVVNRYKCIDTADAHFGDLVNIPLYIPVVVKPYLLLSDSEAIVRNKILRIMPPSITGEKSPPKRSMVKRDSVIAKVQKQSQPTYFSYEGSAIYAYNSWSSGTIIGFFYRRHFYPIKPNDYQHYAVPKWAQDILSNRELLKKMLKERYGEYFIDIAE